MLSMLSCSKQLTCVSCCSSGHKNACLRLRSVRNNCKKYVDHFNELMETVEAQKCKVKQNWPCSTSLVILLSNDSQSPCCYCLNYLKCCIPPITQTMLRVPRFCVEICCIPLHVTTPQVSTHNAGNIEIYYATRGLYSIAQCETLQFVHVDASDLSGGIDMDSLKFPTPGNAVQTMLSKPRVA